VDFSRWLRTEWDRVLGFGLIGLHAAMDYENLPGGGHTTTLGVGLHVDIRPSLGL